MQAPAQRTVCGRIFSGNFLNWSATSWLDVLRMALTGGDRVVDTKSTTVLQRAVLPPDGTPVGAGEASYQLPLKLLLPGGVGSAVLWRGAARMGGARCGCERLGCATPATNGSWAAWPRAGWVRGVGRDGRDHALLGAQRFDARVEVCGQDAQGRLLESRAWPRCQRQPSGYHKPIGVLQSYAHRLRLAVSTALADVDPACHRRAMARRCARRCNASEDAGLMHWAGTTHRLVETRQPSGTPAPACSTAIPWACRAGVGGVINTINRIGRSGMYPGRNALGGMHLEALRYLQGQRPTAAAVVGLDRRADNRLYGGLPAYARWADPYAGRDASADHTCHRAHLLVLGARSAADYAQRPAPNPALDLPDIGFWSATVRHFVDAGRGPLPDAMGTSQNVPPAARPDRTRSSLAPTVPAGCKSTAARTGRARRTSATLPGTAAVHAAKRGAACGCAPWWWTPRHGCPPRRTTTAMRCSWRPSTAAMRRMPPTLQPMCTTCGAIPLQSAQGDAFDLGTLVPAMGPRRDYIWAGAEAGREGVARTYYRTAAAPQDTVQAFEALFQQALSSRRSGASACWRLAHSPPKAATAYRSLWDSSNWRGDVQAYRLTLDAQRQIGIAQHAAVERSGPTAALPDAARSRNVPWGCPVQAQRHRPWIFVGLPSTVLQQASARAYPGAVPDALGHSGCCACAARNWALPSTPRWCSAARPHRGSSAPPATPTSPLPTPSAPGRAGWRQRWHAARL